MSTVSEMIKAQHAKGELLFKGDVPGHEFHGNQYGDSINASASANDASSRAKRTGNADEHARAARLHWRAARLAMNDESRQSHANSARAHDVEANKK